VTRAVTNYHDKLAPGWRNLPPSRTLRIVNFFVGGAALLGLNALSHCGTQWECGFVGPWMVHGPALDLIGFYSQPFDFDRAS
jgi:hypothetical protein